MQQKYSSTQTSWDNTLGQLYFVIKKKRNTETGHSRHSGVLSVVKYAQMKKVEKYLLGWKYRQVANPYIQQSMA